MRRVTAWKCQQNINTIVITHGQHAVDHQGQKSCHAETSYVGPGVSSQEQQQKDTCVARVHHVIQGKDAPRDRKKMQVNHGPRGEGRRTERLYRRSTKWNE